jgi:hypothetical protein
MKKKISTKIKSGDTIVIRNIISEETDENISDRILFQYTDAETLVSYFRKRDDPNGKLVTNEEYMRMVNNTFREVFEGNSNLIPTHSAEAFVDALARVGLIKTTVLH